MLRKYTLLLLAIFPLQWVHAQEPLDDTTFFTPASFYEKIGLKKSESNKRLRVYYQPTQDKADDIERTVDIRWVFASKAQAQEYLNKNLLKESEEGYPMKKAIKLPNAGKVYLYRENQMSSGMYDMMGAEIAQWYYIFVIDRVMIKVFTAGNKTSMATSYAVALEAAKYVSSKLNLPVKETEIEKFDLQLATGFKERIEKGNLAFVPLPGFEPAKIDEALTNYFDQEFKLPGENYAVRYFIVKNDEDIQGLLSDSMVYKKYCRSKRGASLSVSLNIMGGMPGNMPNSEEIADRARCKKINNSDFIIEYVFEIGGGSQLAKGYKYCYMYATYKKDQPDSYVIFLSDDTKKLGLFQQLHKSSIKYSD